MSDSWNAETETTELLQSVGDFFTNKDPAGLHRAVMERLQRAHDEGVSSRSWEQQQEALMVAHANRKYERTEDGKMQYTTETRETLRAIHQWIEQLATERMERATERNCSTALSGLEKLNLAKLLREELEGWLPVWTLEILEEAAEAAKHSVRTQVFNHHSVSEDEVAAAVRKVGDNR